MRRKPGGLTPTEARLLAIARELGREFHGWELARAMQRADGTRHPIPTATLYVSLERLEEFGYLTGHMEDPELAAAEKRPRRRYYRVAGDCK